MLSTVSICFCVGVTLWQETFAGLEEQEIKEQQCSLDGIIAKLGAWSLCSIIGVVAGFATRLANFSVALKNLCVHCPTKTHI